MIITTAANLVCNYIKFYYLSPDAIEEARKRFSAMRTQGVIKEHCEFYDDVWNTTDQYANVGLHFSFNQFSYNGNYYEILNMSFTDFKDCVKTYIVSLFGKNALQTIRSLLLDLRHIIETPPAMIFALSQEIHISNPNLCADFFTQLPNNEENEPLQRLADAMDAYAENFTTQNSAQRTLADFESYFIFDEYLKRFWFSAEVPQALKLFYFPIYIWWMLTAIIPLRPKEFLVIERNCLIKKDGHYFLRLRRSQLKGNNQGVSYNLSDDFYIDTIPVPDYIGTAIEQYIAVTEDYPSTEIDTLFRTVSHYEKWGQSVHSNSRFLTYANLRTILRYFYEEVLHSMYGLQQVCLDDGIHLEQGQISKIHLGDARHIALINLMHSGGTPMLAMVLAGHKNDIMASHYYSNIQKFLECRTYLYHNKMLSEGNKMQILPYHPLETSFKGIPLSDGGKCFNEQILKRNYKHCEETIGPNGEIGYCPKCDKYRGSSISRYEVDDVFLRKIKEACDGLQDAVEIVRSGKGNADVEEIGEALLKIQANTFSYERYMLMKYEHGDDTYGST